MLVQLYQRASPREGKEKKKQGLSGTQQLICGKEKMRIPRQDRSREVKHKIHVLGKGNYDVMSSWQERELEEIVRVLPQHHQSQLERVKQIIQQEQVEVSVDRAGAELSTVAGLATS